MVPTERRVCFIYIWSAGLIVLSWAELTKPTWFKHEVVVLWQVWSHWKFKHLFPQQNNRSATASPPVLTVNMSTCLRFRVRIKVLCSDLRPSRVQSFIVSERTRAVGNMINVTVTVTVWAEQQSSQQKADVNMLMHRAEDTRELK